MDTTNLLREIFKEITKKDSPYYDVYYLTDTELKFSINDDRVGRFLTYSIRYEDDKYNCYSFERSQILKTVLRYDNKKDIKNKQEFWKWFSSFYNDLH